VGGRGCVGGKRRNARGSFNYQKCQVRIRKRVREKSHFPELSRRKLHKVPRAISQSVNLPWPTPPTLLRGSLTLSRSASHLFGLAAPAAGPGRLIERAPTICGYNQSRNLALPVRADLVCMSAISGRSRMVNESLVVYL
jgi:hypothetical protein